MISRMDKAPSSVPQEQNTLVVGQMGSSSAMAHTNGPMGIHFKDNFEQARNRAMVNLYGRTSVLTMAHGCKTVWRGRECLRGQMDVATRDNGKIT